MTARSNGAARGGDKIRRNVGEPSDKIAREGVIPADRARARVRVTASDATRRRGVRALKRERERRSGRRAFVRVETCGRCGHGRRCYVNSHVGFRYAIKSCNAFLPVRVSTPRFTPEYFCVFYTKDPTVCEYQVRVLVTSSHARSGRRTLFRGRVLFPPGASLVSDLVARERETSRRRAGVSLARASVPRARPRASPDRGSRSARSPFPRPGDRRAVPTSLRRTRAACVRVGATKWRAAPPPKRCDTERPSAVARPHPRLATRAPSRPRDARRRCPDSIRPPNGSPRRPNVSTSKEVEEFARARRRGREGKEIIADEPRDRTTGETPPRDAKHAARRPLPDDDDAGADEDRNAGSDSDACTNYGDRVGGEEARRPEEKEKSTPRVPSSGDRRATPPRPATSGWTASKDASPGPPCDLPIEYWTRSEACTERARARRGDRPRGRVLGHGGSHREDGLCRRRRGRRPRTEHVPVRRPARDLALDAVVPRADERTRDRAVDESADLAEAKPSVTSWNYDLNDNNSVDAALPRVPVRRGARDGGGGEREPRARVPRTGGD